MTHLVDPFFAYQGYIDEARSQGLVVSCGGVKPSADSGLPAGGYYIPATIIEDPPVTARVWQEEIFGPVLCIRVRRLALLLLTTRVLTYLCILTM